MKRLQLSHRLSAIFAALLLACCGASAWLQMRASERYEQEVVQRLSSSLAAHIASHSALMKADGLNAQLTPPMEFARQIRDRFAGF